VLFSQYKGAQRIIRKEILQRVLNYFKYEGVVMSIKLKNNMGLIKNNYYLDRFLAFVSGGSLVTGIVFLFINWKIGVPLIILWFPILPMLRTYLKK
jgi:hypothetical protein